MSRLENRIKMRRDYAAEIRAKIEEMLDREEEWIAGIVAAKLVAQLRETDPELLDGWLQEGAADFIRQTITKLDHAHRTHSRTVAKNQTLAKAVEAAETGDTGPLTEFLSTVYEGAGGTRKRLADMKREDLDFASNKYFVRADQNRIAGMFLKALAEKVGNGQVRDHFSEEQLAKMWQSIS